MNRDDIIRMAREAGFVIDEKAQQHQPNCIFHTYYMVDELLTRFAALVAAAERERLKQSIRHSLTIGPKTIQTRVYFGEEEVSIVKMPIEEVVAAEREACVEAVRKEWMNGSKPTFLRDLENAIRARGQA
jgi:hypothetical protein